MKHEIPLIKYTKLSELSEPGEYNCYGIIYDASFPQIQEQSQQGASKYECTIKLIDENINFLNCADVSTFNNNIITLIIKSQFKEKIPYIHTIGDIIRIHSGIYSHKNKKNIYLQIATTTKGQTNASWCIFSGLISPDDDNNKTILPILSSKRYYQFDTEDKIIIKELRNFIKNKLSIPKSICFPMETALDKRIINKENDTTVKVNYKTELDDKYIYYVQDDTDICELQTNKYFDFIHVGDIIRIRSYRFTEKNILSTNQFSNILIIPKTLGYYKEFQEKIKEQKIKNDKDKKNKKGINNNDINTSENEPLINFEEYISLNNPKINNINYKSKYKSNIIPLNEENENENKKLNLFNINDYNDSSMIDQIEKKIKLSVIDFNPNNKPKKFSQIIRSQEDNIIEVQIIKYHPANLIKCVKYICNKCKTNSSIENDFKANLNSRFICPYCESVFVPNFYYNMVFECIEKKKADKIIILHLNSYDGEGESIFGVMPTNFNLQNEQKNKLDKILNELIESKGFVKLKIRKVYLNNKGIIFRIVGDYTNKVD
jgi:hypothetical protein